MFYRYKEAVEDGGVQALLDKTRRKPNTKNRVDEITEQAVLKHAIDFPAHGQLRTSNELRKLGTFISPSGVRSIWLRHNLACFKDRLKALEAKVASEGIILTEVQVAALERKKDDDVACGEIETAHPGYLGSQDTFYVGTFKGVGRIYQQTFIDTYSKVAFAMLYTTKTPVTAADMLNDRVLPFFEQHELPMLRILTDRGTEYCGRADQHDYQLYLALNDIEHTKTKVKSPFIAHSGMFITGNPMLRDQLQLVQATVPESETVAAWQSGTLGFFRDRVINLDGKVNPVALRHRSDILEYLDELKIRYVCDWDSYIETTIGLERFKKHWVRVGQKSNFFLWRRRDLLADSDSRVAN